MENPDPRSKRKFPRRSNSNGSLSDADSTTSWYSPFASDDPSFQPENDIANKNTKSIVSVDQDYSPVPSPGKSNLPASTPAARVKSWHPWPRSEKHASANADLSASGGNGGRRENSVLENHDSAAKVTSSAVLGFNRLIRDEPRQIAKITVGGLEEGYGGGGEDAIGGDRAKPRGKAAVRRAALMFRVFEMVVCLISFSVMAADKTQGWSGDSFDRYIEYRYCLAVNIIGFVYSGFQAMGLACYLGTGKHVVSHNFQVHFDFSMDQIMAYLLLSSSSCAATRVTDWISNWGKDEFTLMASGSIAMSFLAFVAFALSSMVSGYNLCNRDL